MAFTVRGHESVIQKCANWIPEPSEKENILNRSYNSNTNSLVITYRIDCAKISPMIY